MMKQKIVIKLGGSALQNSETLKQLTVMVRGFQNRKYDVVLVHGGGPLINQELTARGIEWKFIEGQRQTTPEMIDVIDQVLAGDINGMLVHALKEAQISAVGLSGARDQILLCSQLNAELMQVGKVDSVNTTAIDQAFSALPGVVTVVAPLGVGKDGEKYNINADWAATQLSIALKAEKLIFLTDQLGILDHRKHLINKVTPESIEQLIDIGVISGGMCAKVRAMTAALKSGVKQIRVLHASSASLIFKDKKLGTVLTETITQTRAVSKREVMHGRAS